MASKPKAKTDTKTRKSETAATAASKADAPKAEASKSDDAASTGTTENSSSDSSSSESGGGSKSSSGDSRPISYFSSVSTDDYRAGWDGVFGGGATKAKPAKRAARKVNKLPMTMTLDTDDLDPVLRDQLDAAFRQQAKKKRLNYDKLSGNGQVSLQISCRIVSS